MGKVEERQIIAEKIREFLKDQNLSQKQFARRAYISESDLSKILHAKRGTQPDELKRIANAMHCDTDFLLGKRDEKTKENTDIMALMPLDEEAVEILQDLKKDCEVSQEAQYIADLISFFIKALYSDSCGEDSVSFIRALNGISELCNGHFWTDEEGTESRVNHVYYVAYKEELRETAARIFIEFCKNHSPIYSKSPMDIGNFLDPDLWVEIDNGVFARKDEID